MMSIGTMHQDDDRSGSVGSSRGERSQCRGDGPGRGRRGHPDDGVLCHADGIGLSLLSIPAALGPTPGTAVAGPSVICSPTLIVSAWPRSISRAARKRHAFR